MFHPPFAYCLCSAACREWLRKPDLPSVWPAPAASVFQVSVLSAFPAPGVGCISGFRPCLFLRFPTLPAPPVSGVGCFSGFHLVRLCGFSLPAPPVPGVVRFSVFIFPPLRFFSLFCSSGSRMCPALRLDALLCQPFVSPLPPPPFVTQPAARRLSPENLPSPTAPGCASSPLGRFTPSTNRIGQPRLLSSM